MKIFIIATLFFIMAGCSGNYYKIKDTDIKNGILTKEVEDEKKSSIKNSYNGMIKIPDGEFIMGSNKKDSKQKSKRRGIGTKRPLYVDEYPERKIALNSFYIDKFEVTAEQYKTFDPFYNLQDGKGNHPATRVNWYDAVQYCMWFGKRLPTEAEWEKAARGTDGREFPWGYEFDKKKLNYFDETGTTPVGYYEEGKSPYGVYDMAGNVWEWTTSWYEPYEGNDYISENFGRKFKIARGGGFGGGHYNLSVFFRTTHRLPLPRDFKGEDIGFRCAKGLPKM